MRDGAVTYPARARQHHCAQSDAVQAGYHASSLGIIESSPAVAAIVVQRTRTLNQAAPTPGPPGIASRVRRIIECEAAREYEYSGRR